MQVCMHSCQFQFSIATQFIIYFLHRLFLYYYFSVIFFIPFSYTIYVYVCYFIFITFTIRTNIKCELIQKQKKILNYKKRTHTISHLPRGYAFLNLFLTTYILRCPLLFSKLISVLQTAAEVSVFTLKLSVATTQTSSLFSIKHGIF